MAILDLARRVPSGTTSLASPQSTGRSSIVLPLGIGLLGMLALSGVYLGIVSLADSPQHALDLFWEDRWLAVPIIDRLRRSSWIVCLCAHGWPPCAAWRGGECLDRRRWGAVDRRHGRLLRTSCRGFASHRWLEPRRQLSRRMEDPADGPWPRREFDRHRRDVVAHPARPASGPVPQAMNAENST